MKKPLFLIKSYGLEKCIIFAQTNQNILGVISLKYEDLGRMLEKSSSTRQYFLSLPVEMQIALHEQNDQIHTAEELRRQAGFLETMAKQIAVSEYFRFLS